MYHKQLQLLGLLLELTQGGRAVWRRDGAETHRTTISEFPCCVRFKHLGLAGGNASEPDAVEVSIGAERLMFCCGSEGFDLVAQIIEAAYPEVFAQAHHVAIRLDAMMNRIENAAT
jgi:hypothetical protein